MSVFICTLSPAGKEGRKIWGSLKRMTNSLKGMKRYAYLTIEKSRKSNRAALDNRWPDHPRSRSHNVISGTTSYRFFFSEIVFSATWRIDTMKWRHYACLRSINDYIWLLTSLDLSKVIRVHCFWLTPCWPSTTKLIFDVFLELLMPSMCLDFHRDVFIVPLDLFRCLPV